MKYVILLSFFTLLSFSSLHAQSDDWQIGGGVGNDGSYSRDVIEETPREDDNSYSFVDLFRGAHEDAPWGIQIGYVNKAWTTDFGDYTWSENLWGDHNKRLHGLQIGFLVQPCLKFGLGLHSGIFYECYISQCNSVKDMGWDQFNEHNLYIPLHAMYRFPFARNVSFMIFGGIGFNWAISGEYRENGHEYYDSEGDSHYYGPYEYQEYGTGNWPRRVNFSAELGGQLRISCMQLSFTYSRGLTDHKFYQGYSTRQNKIGISLAFVGDFGL